MALYRWNDRTNQWEVRGALVPIGDYRVAKPDDNGADVHGKKLLEITLHEAQMAIANGSHDVYYYTASLRPRTFTEQLVAANLAAQDTFLQVWVYCPDLRNLPEETPRQRIVRFCAAINAAARYRLTYLSGPSTSSQKKRAISQTLALRTIATTPKSGMLLKKPYVVWARSTVGR